MRVLISISAQQKGFFVSLGRHISSLGHTVRFLPRDRDVATLIQRLAPDLAEGMLIVNDYECEIPMSEVVRRALDVEERYGVRLAMLLSYDRALGRGYIFNADRYPMIARANWDYQRKLAYLLKRFYHAEEILDHYRPDLLIRIQKDEVLGSVADKRRIQTLTPSPVKIGNRYIWSDDAYITSSRFLDQLRSNVNASIDELPPAGEYMQEVGSKFNQSRIQYSWVGALRDAANYTSNECKSLIRGRRKKDSYPIFGWIPSIFRRVKNYRFFCRFGMRLDEISDSKIVYVPLHLEPEVALLALSPEFNNSMEMIAWISKSLPADAFIVVKEQPYAFGIRSRHYYEQLMQIGNVVLAHPDVASWDWIRAASFTATITGTAATEAVMFGRPVLSFGRHQAVNLLPTVRLATEYESTRKSVDELLALDPEDPIFELSRRALYHAQLSCSFEFSGYEKTYRSSKLEDELAQKALPSLLEALPKWSVRHDTRNMAASGRMDGQ